PMLRLHPLPVTPAAAPAPGRGGAEAGEGGGGRTGGTVYNVPNAFAGSVLNLEPDTEYEARFTLSDPDGVKGKSVQMAKVRTRKEPMSAVGGKVYHVYPANFKGPKQEPSFKGLLGAYYMRESNSDNSNAAAPRVQPGDTILVH